MSLLMLALPAIVAVSSASSPIAQFEQGLVEASSVRSTWFRDEIPLRVGERLLVSAHGMPISGMSLVIESPPATIARLFQPGSRWIDLITVETIESSELTRQARSFTQRSSAAIEEEAARFRTAGIRNESVSEVRVSFSAFNVHETTNEWSSVTLRIADAMPIFGSRCSIVTVQRIDRTYVRMQTFHLGIPVPKREHSEVNVITETELKLLRALEVGLGTKSVGAVPLMTGRQPPYWSFDAMSGLADLASKCSKE
jgi:hypothetical protein